MDEGWLFSVKTRTKMVLVLVKAEKKSPLPLDGPCGSPTMKVMDLMSLDSLETSTL